MRVWAKLVGSSGLRRVSYHHLPTGGNASTVGPPPTTVLRMPYSVIVNEAKTTQKATIRNRLDRLVAALLIAFATAPGQVALDREGANSPFSATLSRHIGTPGLEVQQMLTRVGVATTRGKQVPWSNSSLLGEVYLAAK
jgi:hypothetical protein